MWENATKLVRWGTVKTNRISVRFLSNDLRSTVEAVQKAPRKWTLS